MQEADVVEVIDIVVDDVEDEGGVEGDAGHQLLQQLGVPPKSPVPGASSSSRWCHVVKIMRKQKFVSAAWYPGCGMIQPKTMWKVARQDFLCKLLQTLLCHTNSCLPKQDFHWQSIYLWAVLIWPNKHISSRILTIHFLFEGLCNAKQCMPR